MKEPSIGQIVQKARAYDKAVEVTKKLVNAGLVYEDAAVQIFPELKESEDEKIRNFISNELACIRATDENGSDRYKELTNAIAWLEKQGEQKPKDKYTFKSIPRLLEMVKPTDRAKAYCQKLVDSLLQEGYATDAKIVSNCLKQMNGEKVAMATMDEQKSADIQSIEKRAHEVFPDDDDENTPLYRQAFIDGAVDYIDCGCKNSTWSEDDKGILLSIKCVIDNIWHSTLDIDTGGYSKEELKEMWEWLDKIWQRVEYHEEKLNKKDE